MSSELFPFPERKKTLDCTRIVPPTALTKQQIRWLLSWTRASNDKYFSQMALSKLGNYQSKIFEWGVTCRPGWLDRVVKYLKQEHVNNDIDFHVKLFLVFVCFVTNKNKSKMKMTIFFIV